MIWQAVPAKMGFADIAAGNLIGTVLYFTLFNLGLITVLTPVAVPPAVRTLDWPVLVGVSLWSPSCCAAGNSPALTGCWPLRPPMWQRTCGRDNHTALRRPWRRLPPAAQAPLQGGPNRRCSRRPPR